MPELVSPADGSALSRGEEGWTDKAGKLYPVIGGVPRFVSSEAYAGGFGVQWKYFRRTQLDSYSGTVITRERLTRCFGGDLSFLKGKKVLEAGCGSGRFTEVLLSTGAYVTSFDLSEAVEANYENHAGQPNLFLAQADIRALPFVKGSFDAVMCLGVIQHTPDPEQTIAALASYVAPGGMLVIDHYTQGYPMPLPRRICRQWLLKMPKHKAFDACMKLSKALVPLHRLAWRKGRVAAWARRLLQKVSPLVDYYDSYPTLSLQVLEEWALLDTHDLLTDVFKHLRSPEQIRATLQGLGFEVEFVALAGNGVEARARRIA